MTREQIEPTGLLPSEVIALRHATSTSPHDFGRVFGVSGNVVERWETLGVPSGPTALALRLVAHQMEFEFPQAVADDGVECTICGAPAPEEVHGLPVCAFCHREPVQSMEGLGFSISSSENHISGYETIHTQLPEDRELAVTGRFMSEGLGTMMTKLFKEEPQLGNAAWDEAVYVHWIEPGLEALEDAGARDLLKSLVAYGVVDLDAHFIDVQYAPHWGSFQEEIILLSGLLSKRLSP